MDLMEGEKGAYVKGGPPGLMLMLRGKSFFVLLLAKE
jgi:hypothetical protein